MGSPRDRDAGPSRDPQFRSPFLGLSLFEKPISITQWVDQKCMLFDTSCFKNLLLAKMRIFRKFVPPHFSTVFSTICGTVVEENEKTQGDRNYVFETWPILRLREVEISVRDMCHKTSGFATCCLSLWCRRCLWRVSSSRSCCHEFYTRKHV